MLASDPPTVWLIAGKFPGISRPAVSKHLRVLRVAGVPRSAPKADRKRAGQAWSRRERTEVLMNANSPRERLLLCLLLVASTGFNAVGIRWGLGGESSWAQDEIRPVEVFNSHAWPGKYPPLHRHLLSAILGPAQHFLSDERQEREILALLERLVSLVFAAGVLYFVYRIGQELMDGRAALLAAVSVAVSPVFVFYGKTANLETPYVFWFTLSIWFLALAWKRGHLRHFLLCGAAAAAAVTTKDQAYALYLGLAPAILWRVASEIRPRRESARVRGRLRRASTTVVDARIWGTVLVAAIVFAAVYAIGGGWQELVRHVDLIALNNRAAVSQYREFGRELSDLPRMIALAVRHAAYMIGWPLLVVAVAGVVLALRRREVLLIFLAFVPVAYFLGFIWVIGYHYLRFFYPLLPILALFVARAWLPALDRFPRAAALAFALLCTLPLLRAASVNAAMLGDSRYDVERVVAEETGGDLGKALFVGRVQVMPPGLSRIGWENLWPNGCRFLDQYKPGVVVINASDVWGESEKRLLAGFSSGLFNYSLEYRFEASRLANSLGPVRSNFSYISPEMLVFRRLEEPCIDDKSLASLLRRKKWRRHPNLTARLLRAAINGDIGTRLDPEGRSFAVGLTSGHWTSATRPALIALHNFDSRPLGVELELQVWARPKDRPIPVKLRDGDDELKIVFRRNRVHKVRLRPLAAGEERLVWLWSKKAWPGRETPPRWLGVQLAGIRLEPHRGEASSSSGQESPTNGP